MKRNGGFTLIELLVVIAIIGLLASIILASIATARAKGNDAAIKGNLSDLRDEMELHGSNYGATFTSGLCPTSGSTIFYTDPVIATFVTKLNGLNSSQTLCAAGNTSGATAISWAVASPLSTFQMWCVDYSGNVELSDDGDSFLRRYASDYIPFADALGYTLGGGNTALAHCP